MRKLTLTVNILDTAVPVGQEYVSNSYPCDGLFLTTAGMLYIRSGLLITFVGSAPAAFLSELMSSAGEPPEPAAQTSFGISEMAMLRAIAIAQKPELALELCK